MTERHSEFVHPDQDKGLPINIEFETWAKDNKAAIVDSLEYILSEASPIIKAERPVLDTATYLTALQQAFEAGQAAE